MRPKLGCSRAMSKSFMIALPRACLKPNLRPSRVQPSTYGCQRHSNGEWTKRRMPPAYRAILGLCGVSKTASTMRLALDRDAAAVAVAAAAHKAKILARKTQRQAAAQAPVNEDKSKGSQANPGAGKP